MNAKIERKGLELNLQEIFSDFSSRGIDPQEVGFCDSATFLAAEREDPSYLEMYARYVDLRAYELEYLDWSARVVPVVSKILHEQLLETGRLGGCVDMSGILSKTLDKCGIWNYCVKGSLTVEFPEGAGLEAQHYWTYDHGEFIAGHAWVVAPPFNVIDLTVQQQPCPTAERELLPAMVVQPNLSLATFSVEDVVSDSIRLALWQRGTRDEDVLRTIAPHFLAFSRNFVPRLHVTENGTRLKYVPVAIGGPDAPLEGISNMKFGTRTAHEVYMEIIAPRVAQL
ncbi:hypothetical protein [uncultured Lamprocystis sp.]|uniref:hypothetical protein n=1 Tax=uncultured Lamprocystis sp. TaxID=543132 RepID=UPI0025DCCAAF|nr:hypothetical protein [uncultured Lamprocystis sp.]